MLTTVLVMKQCDSPICFHNFMIDRKTPHEAVAQNKFIPLKADWGTQEATYKG